MLRRTGDTVLVGRREQLAHLEEELQTAHTGEPRFVLLGGEAGLGKTALMEHFAARVEETGMRVLRGACVELGTEGLPLAPLTAVLRDLIAQTGVEASQELFPGARELTGLLPELGDTRLAHGGQGRMFELFGALLRRLGEERAVLLLIDDLHWADRSTRELVGYLARSLRATRVLTLLAYRSGDLDRRHPLSEALSELERLPRVRRMALPRFGRAEATELIAADQGRPPAPGLVDDVLRRSNGIPFAIVELAGEETLPESLTDVLLARLGRMDPRARHVVRLAAVGGREVPHELLAATAGLGEEDLFEALRLAVDARMLEPVGDGYQPRHSLLQEAVLSDLLPAQRRRIHRRFAEALEAKPALVAAESYAAHLAHHYDGAGETVKALPALLAAAEAAERIFAHAEQAQLLSRALDITETDRPALFAQASIAAVWGGEATLGLSLVDRALAETDHRAEPARAAMLLAQRGMVLHNLMRTGALTAAEEAERLLVDLPPARNAPVLDLLAALYAASSHWERARALAERAMGAAAEVGAAAEEINARSTLGAALSRTGHCSTGLEELRAAREKAHERGDVMRLARIDINLAHTLASLGEHAQVIDTARRGLEISREAGLARTLGAIPVAVLTGVLTTLGRWDEALDLATQTLEQDPSGAFAAILHARCGQIALYRGETAAAAEHRSLARALVGHASGVPAYALVAILSLEAGLALADNRIDAARAAVTAVIPVVLETGEPDAWPVLGAGARTLTRAHVSGHETASLREQLTDAVRHLPRGAPLWEAYAAEFAAEIDEESWKDAIAAWDALGDSYRAAYARMRAAERAAQEGDRGRVPELLRVAAASARELGAGPLLREIELLARGAHVRLDAAVPNNASMSERFGLSEREGEVLRLVAEGRSNRQIAESLFISPKTASVHVSRILGKLGVASRGEAAATAHRLGLFED